MDADDPTRWVSRCPRCLTVTALDDGVAGCPACAADGIGMPMVPVRVDEVVLEVPGPSLPGVGAMWRWQSHLAPVGAPVSLGEGGTPLVSLDLSGVPGRVLLKDERANPTGSFKDRLASAVVSRARHRGARTVVVSSSGNAGIAVGAYAAAAGLRCVLLAAADPGLAGPTAAAADATGTRVCLTDTFLDRWTAARTGVENLGWYPVTNHVVPPVASNPVGFSAYRTIAFEIAEGLGWAVPDWVVVPVSRGDGLFGVWSGFVEMTRLGWTESVPRMLAVVRHPSLTDALARGAEQPDAVEVDGPVATASIGDPQATAMSVHAVRESRGDAVLCDDTQASAAWQACASRGVLLELSSAVTAHGAAVLADRGVLADGSTTVLLGTAGPYAQRTLTTGAAGRYVEDPTDPSSLRAAAEGD